MGHVGITLQATQSIQTKLSGQNDEIGSILKRVSETMDLAKRIVFAYAALRSRFSLAYVASVTGAPAGSTFFERLDVSAFYDAPPALPSPVLVLAAQEMEKVFMDFARKFQRLRTSLTQHAKGRGGKLSTEIVGKVLGLVELLQRARFQVANEVTCFTKYASFPSG